MSWIKLIVVLIVVIYVLVGLFLFLFQEKMIFQPEPLDPEFAYEFETEFDELNMEMDDGAVLNALHFKPEQPKGIIVYFHGNAGNLARWGDVVEPFTNYGYEVLIVDYRGYGKSTGDRSKQAMFKDAEMVYGYAAELWQQEKIIVYGRSLGSSFACHVAAHFQPAHLILESPFYSVADVARELTWMYPTSAILRFNFQNGLTAARINVPVTILHGSEDRIVPLASGQKLHKAMKKAEMHVIEAASHNDLAAFKGYWDVIDRQLQ
jgi:hypothetical protein